MGLRGAASPLNPVAIPVLLSELIAGPFSVVAGAFVGVDSSIRLSPKRAAARCSATCSCKSWPSPQPPRDPRGFGEVRASINDGAGRYVALERLGPRDLEQAGSPALDTVLQQRDAMTPDQVDALRETSEPGPGRRQLTGEAHA